MHQKLSIREDKFGLKSRIIKSRYFFNLEPLKWFRKKVIQLRTIESVWINWTIFQLIHLLLYSEFWMAVSGTPCMCSRPQICKHLCPSLKLSIWREVLLFTYNIWHRQNHNRRIVFPRIQYFEDVEFYEITKLCLRIEWNTLRYHFHRRSHCNSKHKVHRWVSSNV